jgi:importin subunit alpha-1
MECGIAPLVQKFLTNVNNPDLQFESISLFRILSSVAGEIAVTSLVDNGIIPLLIPLLHSQTTFGEAIGTLTNIAEDSATSRDKVLHHGIMEQIIQIDNLPASANENISIYRLLSTALSAVCHGKPPPPYHLVKNSLPLLEKYLLFETDHKILSRTCDALFYLADISDESRKEILSSGIVPKVLAIVLKTSFKDVQVFIVRMFGVITSSDDETVTQQFLNMQPLPTLAYLLKTSSNHSLKKELCWCVSNITTGSVQQIQLVINQSDLLPTLVDIIQLPSRPVQTEAAWALVNVTENGTFEQLQYLVTIRVFPVFLELLSVAPEGDFLEILLKGMKRIILKYQEMNKLSKLLKIINRENGKIKLEILLEHWNATVYQLAEEILLLLYPEEMAQELEKVQIDEVL